MNIQLSEIGCPSYNTDCSIFTENTVNQTEIEMKYNPSYHLMSNGTFQRRILTATSEEMTLTLKLCTAVLAI